MKINIHYLRAIKTEQLPDMLSSVKLLEAEGQGMWIVWTEFELYDGPHPVYASVEILDSLPQAEVAFSEYVKQMKEIHDQNQV